jgi:hypothetical protein
MKVVLKRRETSDGRVIGTLKLGNAYEVIGIEGNDYRIVDENGEPILFEPGCFDLLDASEPDFWLSRVEGGVRYAYPPDWMRPGFFEDFFDRKDEIRRAFWSQHTRYYGRGDNGDAKGVE